MIAEQDRLLINDIEEQKARVELAQEKIEGTLTDGATAPRARPTSENERLASLRAERAASVQTIQTPARRPTRPPPPSSRTHRDARCRGCSPTSNAGVARKPSVSARRAATPQPYTGDFARGGGRSRVAGARQGRRALRSRVHPKWGTTTMNNGIDIEAPMGAPVRAVAQGPCGIHQRGLRRLRTDRDPQPRRRLLHAVRAPLGDPGRDRRRSGCRARSWAASGDTGSLKGTMLHFEVRKGGSRTRSAGLAQVTGGRAGPPGSPLARHREEVT